MERLTQPGIDYCKDICGRMPVCARFNAVKQKMVPCGDAAIYNKLRDYEDAEAEGRLLVLPCKVGDTVYCIRKNPFGKGRYVKENTAESITCYRSRFSIFSTLNDILGKTVFLTREEAEAALKAGADV